MAPFCCPVIIHDRPIREVFDLFFHFSKQLFEGAEPLYFHGFRLLQRFSEIVQLLRNFRSSACLHYLMKFVGKVGKCAQGVCFGSTHVVGGFFCLKDTSNFFICKGLDYRCVTRFFIAVYTVSPVEQGNHFRHINDGSCRRCAPVVHFPTAIEQIFQ